MSEFIPKKQVLLQYYLLNEDAAETCCLLMDVYGHHAPSEPTYRHWFQRLKTADFDVNDKERDGAPKRFQNEELEELLDINQCQALKELSGALDVDRFTVGKSLHALGMVQKAGNWVPNDLIITKSFGIYGILEQ
ncbi:hypothetical protein Trydic_g9470 [Trypoxylus dichotomus]